MMTDPRAVADFLAALTDDEFRAFADEARTPGALIATPADQHNPTARHQPANPNERHHP